MGIPFRRGYLFHGPPGSGKTSIITALASELKYSISIINMADKLMDDSRFLHLLNKAPPHTLVGKFQPRMKIEFWSTYPDMQTQIIFERVWFLVFHFFKSNTYILTS